MMTGVVSGAVTVTGENEDEVGSKVAFDERVALNLALRFVGGGAAVEPLRLLLFDDDAGGRLVRSDEEEEG